MKNGLNFFVESKNHQEFWKNFSLWEQNDLNFVVENGEENKIFIDIKNDYNDIDLAIKPLNIQLEKIEAPEIKK